MGQTIEIKSTVTVGDVLIVDADRSITGQDGEFYNGVEAARRGSTFPAALATRLLEGIEGVDHVHVMSNTVSVRRPGGWDDEAIASAARIVSEFFRFYPDASAVPA